MKTALAILALATSLATASGSAQAANGGEVPKVADAHKLWAESGITKDIVHAQISNIRCFSSNDNLEACRTALGEARKESGKLDHEWDEDDFDSVIDQVDHRSGGDKTKEWIFGLMMNSYVRSFDAHASVMPLASFRAAIGPGADIHYGIGIKIMATDAGVFVRAVTPNSPADAAGLKPFDRLIAVNGTEVGTGVRGRRDSDLIKGVKGDTLELLIDRAGVRQTVKVTIGVVTEQNVTAEVTALNGRRYAYIRFAQFKDGSCDDLKVKIRGLPNNVVGVILDLRDNPGGLLEQGICVAGLLVGKKDIVGQKQVPIKFPLTTSYHPSPDGLIEWYPSYRDAAFPKTPVIVLINQSTASAAEIVSGALQDFKRAWIVGDRSFGKGSVQTLEPMPSEPSLYVGYTSALFYRPNGSTNQLAGVTPDFAVPLRRRATPAEMRGPREGDIYPNSIRPLEAQMQWTQTRPEADMLRRCVEITAVDLTANKMIIEKAGSEDYQKAYALGVLYCAIGMGSQKSSSFHFPSYANSKNRPDERRAVRFN